jgi:hypothetical protein
MQKRLLKILVFYANRWSIKSILYFTHFDLHLCQQSEKQLWQKDIFFSNSNLANFNAEVMLVMNFIGLLVLNCSCR